MGAVHTDLVRTMLAALGSTTMSEVTAVLAAARAREGASTSPRVAAAAKLTELAQQTMLSAVAADRADGATWASIGHSLGITRTAAHNRFSEPLQARTDEAQKAADESSSPVSPEAQLGLDWLAISELAEEQRVRAAAAIMTTDEAAEQLATAIETERQPTDATAPMADHPLTARMDALETKVDLLLKHLLPDER